MANSGPANQCDLIRLSFQRLSTYEHLTTLIKPFHTYCDRGHEKSALILGLYEDFGIYYQCQVESCQQQWVVCCQCRNIRSKLTSRKSVWNHKNKVHSLKRLKGGVEEEPRNKSVKRSTDALLAPNDPADISKRHCEGQFSCSVDLYSESIGLEQGAVTNHTSLDATESDYGDNIGGYDTDKSSEKVDNGRILTSTHQINFREIPENGALWFSSSRNERFFQFCRSRSPNTM